MAAHNGEKLKEKLSLKRAPAKQIRVPTGHEALLNKYRKGEVKIRFTLNSDQMFEGKIVSFDKYTVTIKSANPEDEIGDLEVTIFKHAIMAFFPSPAQE